MRDPNDVGLIFVFVFKTVFLKTLGCYRNCSASVYYGASSSAPAVLACAKIGLGLTMLMRSIFAGCS